MVVLVLLSLYLVKFNKGKILNPTKFAELLLNINKSHPYEWLFFNLKTTNYLQYPK